MPKTQVMTAEVLLEAARECGFDCAGIASAAMAVHGDSLLDWLSRGRQGGMAWMAQSPERRIDPRRYHPETRSILVVGLYYFSESPDPAYWDDPLRGRVACYAWGADYHGVMEERLRRLTEWLKSAGAPDGACRPFADAQPLLERDHAATAKLGFIGKNTQLIHPRYGSYLFLGGLLLPFEPRGMQELDRPDRLPPRGCGRCARCLQACPTGALDAPYALDGRRCISYLTIEHRGAIDPSLRASMGRWIFGCDACQTVCPWVQRFAHPTDHARFLSFSPERAAPKLDELLGMDDHALRARFRDTPLWRAKIQGLRRNACIALGNGGSPEAEPALRRTLTDPDPIVREHADWALRRLEKN